MSFRSINDKIFLVNNMSQVFTETAIARLQNFLADNNQLTEFETLTPDASTREYFRVQWNQQSAIACVYGERLEAAEHTYLDVTKLFLANDLPVAEIYQFDEDSGIVIQEDFGDVILRDFLHKSDDAMRDNLLNQAISMIAKIQAATPNAFETDSIASRLRFDEEKLLWELNFFKTHYFETFRKTKLSEANDAALSQEFRELAETLSERASVLCHRDFHAANLMLDKQNQLRIIDHQDARIGATSYDLVSLLLDRVLEPPPEDWLNEKKRYFLNARENLGLETLDRINFDEEFALQTIQRCLKAIGTFSYQSVNRGKTYFVPFIKPMLLIVSLTAQKSQKFINLQRIIKQQLS